MRRIALIHLIVLASSVCGAATADEVTPCDLMRPKAFLSKTVSITGRVVFTMHGAFLVSDRCPNQAQDVVILFPGAEGTPVVNFDLDPHAAELLRPFFRPTGGTTSACGVLFGEVFYRTRFHSRIEGAGPQGNGFGPRGAFRLAFVLRSVQEIRACKAP